MTTFHDEEKIREEWDEAFQPEVPKSIKSLEVKNADGTYSCITCGIKREAIADWWLDKMKSYASHIREETLREQITIKKAAEQLQEELRNDKDLYYAYQANIAVAMQDAYKEVSDKEDIHRISNIGAKNFLDLFISTN